MLNKVFKVLLMPVACVLVVSCSGNERVDTVPVDRTNVSSNQHVPYFNACVPYDKDWIGTDIEVHPRLLVFKLRFNDVQIAVRAVLADLNVTKSNAGVVGYGKFKALERNIEYGDFKPLPNAFKNLEVFGPRPWNGVDFDNWVLVKGWNWDFSKNSFSDVFLNYYPEGWGSEIEGYMIIPDKQMVARFFYSEEYTDMSESIISLVRSQINIYVNACGYHD